MQEYRIVRNMPVAKFYYQGSHSHPVRRTVLVIENHKTYFTGHEMREGDVVRTKIAQAPIKSYSKNKIAKIGQCGRRLRKRIPQSMHANTTFERVKLLDLVTRGV